MTNLTDSLAPRADELASLLLAGDAAKHVWKHTDLVLATTSLVRAHGPAATLDLLRAHSPRHHETLAAFSVWAISRLVDAGLTTMAVLWHPLTETSSALSWWTESDLRSAAARTGWIEPTLATDGEVRPSLPVVPALLAA
jgi:hypothetical protein